MMKTSTKLINICMFVSACTLAGSSSAETVITKKLTAYNTNKQLDALVKYGKKLRFGPPATWGFKSVSKALGFNPGTETSYELVEWKIQTVSTTCQKINVANNDWSSTDASKKAYLLAQSVCDDLIQKIDTKTILNTDTDAASTKIMTIALNAYSDFNGGDLVTRNHYGFSTKQLIWLSQNKLANN